MNLKTEFNTAKILHLALVAGQVIFALILIFILREEANDFGLFLFIPALALWFITLVLSVIFYKRILQQRIEGTKGASLSAKIEAYRSAKILQWVILEGGNLFILIVFFLTWNSLLLPFFLVSLIVLIMARPSVEDFAKAFNLNGNEESEMRKAFRE